MKTETAGYGFQEGLDKVFLRLVHAKLEAQRCTFHVTRDFSIAVNFITEVFPFLLREAMSGADSVTL